MSSNSGESSLFIDNIKQAAACIQRGGVISFPTETYYGLGVDPFNIDAVEKLYELKGRNKAKPISLIVSNLKMLELLVEDIPPQYSTLMSTFWPGPLTLIFPSKKGINDILTADTGTVGVRISSHPVPKAICDELQLPITATSANISGEDPAENNKQILDMFGKKIDFVLPGESSCSGLCSTVVGLEKDKLCLIRKGEISFESILAVF